MDFQHSSAIIETLTKRLLKARQIREKDKILVALSGGPDSVMLFHLVCHLRDRLNATVFAAHVNYLARGAESDKDELFVRRLARRHRAKLFCSRFDLKAKSRASRQTDVEHRGNFEEEARLVRYGFFKDIVRENKIDVLMTGHTLDDQVETFLMRLFRGSGLKGLSAIQKTRVFEGALLLRPLLDVAKADILKYLRRNKILYRQDRTNADPAYTRNRIRHQLVPFLRDKFNPKILGTIFQTVDQIGSAYSYIADHAARVHDEISSGEKGELRLARGPLAKQPAAIRNEVVRLAIERVKGNLRRIDFLHINAVDQMLAGDGEIKAIDMPENIRVRRLDKHIVIEKMNDARTLEQTETILAVPGQTDCYCGRFAARAGALKGHRSKNRYAEVFDFGKLKSALSVRPVRRGDRMTVLGMKSPKLVSKILKDEKIDKKARRGYPVLTDGREIVWLCGVRMSEKYKIGQKTKKALALKYTPKAEFDCRRP